MTTPTPRHALWVDLETTTLDPHHLDACILEIGAVITTHTPALDVIAEARLIVRPPGTLGDHDQLWARLDPFIRDMHETNGLWAAATTGDSTWMIHEADQAIATWVREHVGDEQVPLAGSGVAHMDRPWITAHLPRLATRLTYWVLDVGIQRRMLQLAGRHDLVDLPADVDAKPHRGLDDVHLHLAEGRRYLAAFASLPAVEPAESAP